MRGTWMDQSTLWQSTSTPATITSQISITATLHLRVKMTNQGAGGEVDSVKKIEMVLKKGQTMYAEEILMILTCERQ